MSSGYETSTDTRLDKNIFGDSVGALISKVLAAKVLADKERKFAQKKAFQQGIDEAEFNAMTPPGFFFKKALVGELGGFKVKKKKQELTALYRKALLVGKVTKNKRLRGKVVGQLKQSLIYSKANLKNSKRFRSQFDYTDYETYFEPQSQKIPSTRKKTKNAIDGGGRSKRISREQIIESIDAIAKSIEKTAQSITQSSASVYGTLITSNQLQADVAQDLKVRNTTLEDKLQKLVDAISNQTQVQKNIVDKREDIQQESQLERKTVASGFETPDDLSTRENERKMHSSFVDESEMMAAYGYGYEPPVVRPVNSMVNDMAAMEAYGYPQAEKGGAFSGKGGVELHGTEALLSSNGSAKIVSGPDSGYLHKINKPTTVIPLDNNYTQGEPSAVTGKVETKPRTSMLPKFKLPRFEMGTSNFYNNSVNMNKDVSEPLIETMDLLATTTGGSILALNTSFLNEVGDSGEQIRPEINQISRSIANNYNLPPSVVNKAGKVSSKTKKSLQEKNRTDNQEEKKSLFEKLKEGFSKLLENLGNKINENPPPNNPPPGSKDLTPVDLKGFSEKEVSDLGRMIYAEAGADEKGASQVMNTILNRYRQVKQGKATPQAWGVRSGVTSQTMTLTDLLMAQDQFQPTRDGRFDKVSSEQGIQALNAAISGGGLDPKQIYEKAKASGLSDADAKIVAVADSFANDYGMRNNRPFDSKFVRTDNGHWFGSSPYTGFKPSDLNTSKLPAFTKESSSPENITRNYGQAPDTRVRFQLNGKWYNAYKLNNGYDFYEETPNPLDRDKRITDPKELAPIQDAFIKLKESKLQPPNKTDVSYNLKPSSNGNTDIALLNISNDTETSSAYSVPSDYKVSALTNPVSNFYIS
jgi:hypothetical protein